VRLATLGVILLERTSRPVELSPAGKVLLAEAKGLLVRGAPGDSDPGGRTRRLRAAGRRTQIPGGMNRSMSMPNSVPASSSESARYRPEDRSQCSK
jgi:DNA-binding transcriptional LysR family regulator